MKRIKAKKKKKDNNGGKILKIIFSIIFIICIVFILLYLFSNNKDILDNKINIKTMYLASDTNEVKTYLLESTGEGEEKNEVLKEISPLPRGIKVEVVDKVKKYQDKNYYLTKVEENEYYIEDINLASKDNEVLLEEKIYTRTPTSILNIEDNKIITLSTKGNELEVIGYDKINEDGTVNKYKVKINDKEGYIYGKYISFTKEEAILNYMADKYDKIHSKVKNSYGGGDAIKLDFYPNEKPVFENNKMPDSVYALYLNCGSNVINNIDAYIEFAKTTKINTFVVDIKDNETPAYPAKIFETLSPTTYKKAINSYENYKNAITKLKDAGFYVIGRITVFKDNYFVTDNPKVAISTKEGKPYLHNKSYWPSAYNRDVWYYNVELAKEAVLEFGFNEINFDYVRFPDRMRSVEGKVDVKNLYNESKVEAIQRFVQYATDVLHEENTYVSIDVFGETTTSLYTTAYGQYWPAISNVADVISGMPYPDHFAAGSYGIAKPWNEPYRLMNNWARNAYDRQQEIPTPAKVRTWIQAYDVLKYVDSNGISYGAKEIEDQIRGLYDSKIDGGYITWLSNSNLNKYKSQSKAFNIDYWKEYGVKNG